MGSSSCDNFEHYRRWRYLYQEDLRPSVTVEMTSAIDGPNTICKNILDFNPDRFEFFFDSRPDAEAMREACVFGNLTAVESVFKTYWLDRPVDERIDQNELGASGLCEAFRRGDARIALYLLSSLVSMQAVHFAMATENRACSVLQLYVDKNWDINIYLSRMQPSALS